MDAASAGTRQRGVEPQCRYAYFYLMKADPDAVRLVAPRHAAYWNKLQLAGYVGGPFADRTGGLIIFEAPDDVEAQRTVTADPFTLEGLIAVHWLKEWTPAAD
jgi:uncharacterized protein YciI